MKGKELAFKLITICLLCLLVIIILSGGSKMPRGQADYGLYAPKDVTASVSDMGEVAARLESIVTYDRRGDVVGIDNFEYPLLKWQTMITGTLSTIYLDSVTAKSGSQSVKLITDDEADAQAALWKYVALLASQKLGLETSFSLEAGNVNFLIQIGHYSGAKWQKAVVKLDLVNNILYITDSTNNDKVIATGINLYKYLLCFHTLKLVADFETGYYKRLLFDGIEYDLSSEALFSLASTTTPSVFLKIWIENQDAVGDYIWIDDVIWTQAEP